MSIDTLMRRLMAFTIILLLGVVSWLVSEFATSDAIAMGVGLLFGIMAGIPTTLLIIAGERRSRQKVTPAEPMRFEVVNTDTGQIAPYIMRQLPGLAQIETDVLNAK